MAKTDIPLTGLIGIMESVLETVKRFQDFEERYRANEVSFAQMVEQFRQLQENSTHMQAITEERLASVAALNVELKVRHSQGEQTLEEARKLVGDVKGWQDRWEQQFAATAPRQQADAERTAQLAQTLGVVQALAEQLQSRHGQMEQSLVAMRAFVEDQAKRSAEHEKNVQSVRGMAAQISERQGKLEKFMNALGATQDAEKGLIGRFEKALTAIREKSSELEKRQATAETALAAVQGNGNGSAPASEQTMAVLTGLTEQCKQNQAEAGKIWTSVTGLRKEFEERQSKSETGLRQEFQSRQSKSDQLWQAAAGGAEQARLAVGQLTAKLAASEDRAGKAMEQAQAAQKLAVQAMEKASAPAVTSEESKQTAEKIAKAMEQAQAAQKLAVQAMEKASAPSVSPDEMKRSAESVAKAMEQAQAAQKLAVQAMEKASAPQAAAESKETSEKIARAMAQAQEAKTAAAQALEKAGKAAAAPAIVIANVPDDQKKAATEFAQLVARWDAQHKTSSENEAKLQNQLRVAIEGLPARAESSLEKFLETARGRAEQMMTGWFRDREQRMGELEKRFDGIVVGALDSQKKLENEMMRVSTAAQNWKTAPPDWMAEIESIATQHTSELRFMKTLLWITLAAVGLAYGLVAYLVVLKSSS